MIATSFLGTRKANEAPKGHKVQILLTIFKEIYHKCYKLEVKLFVIWMVKSVWFTAKMASMKTKRRSAFTLHQEVLLFK